MTGTGDEPKTCPGHHILAQTEEAQDHDDNHNHTDDVENAAHGPLP